MSTLRTAPRPGETSPAPSGSDRHSTHRWLALTFLALAQFLVVLDASIVNIALPSIGARLDMDTASLAWVITAYVLPFGSLLLLGGRLADRFGHRRLFLIGVAGFITASALAGLSVNGGMLLTARAIQGASAALLAPAALALLAQLFVSASDRSKALGIWGAVAGIGSAAGVLLGGVLTAAFGWQAVFFVNVPVGATVLVVIPRLIGRDAASSRSRLDVPGAATITGALVAVVGGLAAAERVGFAQPLTIALFVAAVLLGAGFLVIERRASAPLVPLSTFRNRNLTAGNIVMLLAGAAMVALFFALSVFLQAVLHYSALAAGLSQLPLAGALVVVAAVVPSVVSRAGIRPTLLGSLLVLAAGLVWLAAAPDGATFVGSLLGPTLLIGVGLGGAFVTATALSVDGAGGNEAGLAGGLVNTSQQIGGALGLAALSTVAAARTAALQTSAMAAPQALTAGFSLLFFCAAALVVIAAVVTVVIRAPRSGPETGTSATVGGDGEAHA